MNKSRLESFSDGVFAIIITIMVLEIKIPQGSELSKLIPLIAPAVSYLLSFVFIGVYWINHHHLIHSVKNLSAGIIWANLNLLFWLSLIPVSTAWMGENNFAKSTVAVYGILLFVCGNSFYTLMHTVRKNSSDSVAFKKAFHQLNRKGIISNIGYIFAILLSYFNPVISGVIFIVIAIFWVTPNKNIEHAIKSE
jgi:TMEM175 potassium channel family protein